MKINITSGDILNSILTTKYPNELFIPFNEAMIKGDYHHKLFSDEFIQERSIVHNVTTFEYISKLSLFLDFLKNIENYNEVVLWFGDEPFCKKNTSVVLETLEVYGYTQNIYLNIVDEVSGEIISSSLIKGKSND